MPNAAKLAHPATVRRHTAIAQSKKYVGVVSAAKVEQNKAM